MNEEIENKAVPIPSLEFEEKKSQVIVKAINRIRLNEEECEVNRITTLHKEVQYIDYSTGEPVLLIMEVDITPLPITEKKQILKRCTNYDRAGVPEIDFEKMEDLMLSRILGLSENGWNSFKSTHPIGLYTKLSILIRDVNGETTFTDEQISELKNLEGQVQ